jgi:hypothetical protein
MLLNVEAFNQFPVMKDVHNVSERCVGHKGVVELWRLLRSHTGSRWSCEGLCWSRGADAYHAVVGFDSGAMEATLEHQR